MTRKQAVTDWIEFVLWSIDVGHENGWKYGEVESRRDQTIGAKRWRDKFWDGRWWRSNLIASLNQDEWDAMIRPTTPALTCQV